MEVPYEKHCNVTCSCEFFVTCLPLRPLHQKLMHMYIVHVKHRYRLAVHSSLRLSLSLCLVADTAVWLHPNAIPSILPHRYHPNRLTPAGHPVHHTPRKKIHSGKKTWWYFLFKTDNRRSGMMIDSGLWVQYRLSGTGSWAGSKLPFSAVSRALKLDALWPATSQMFTLPGITGHGTVAKQRHVPCDYTVDWHGHNVVVKGRSCHIALCGCSLKILIV